MHLVDLKLVASFSSQFVLSGKHPLDMLYCNSIFHSAIVFEKFIARIFKKESAPVIIWMLWIISNKESLNGHNSESLRPFWLIFSHKVRNCMFFLLIQKFQHLHDSITVRSRIAVSRARRQNVLKLTRARSMLKHRV